MFIEENGQNVIFLFQFFHKLLMWDLKNSESAQSVSNPAFVYISN